MLINMYIVLFYCKNFYFKYKIWGKFGFLGVIKINIIEYKEIFIFFLENNMILKICKRIFFSIWWKEVIDNYLIIYCIILIWFYDYDLKIMRIMLVIYVFEIERLEFKWLEMIFYYIIVKYGSVFCMFFKGCYVFYNVSIKLIIICLICMFSLLFFENYNV